MVMGIQRYLIRFGYSGTRFNGAQKQQRRVELSERLSRPGYSYLDSKSVQGAIESVLYDLRPRNNPIFTLSSRTDKGVHAYHSSGSVDLVHPVRGDYFDPKEITWTLNSALESLGLDIRIYKTVAVPGIFNPRWAKKRVYHYKFAAPKENLYTIVPSIQDPKIFKNSQFHILRQFEHEMLKEKFPHQGILPLEIRNEIAELRKSINAKIFAEALEHFQGKHNFASFCHIAHLKNLWTSYSEVGSQIYQILPYRLFFNFYQIKFTSTSFLYNQIRRMIGSALESSRKGSIENIQFLLANPNPSNWSGVHLADPKGLHLYDIEYSLDVLRDATDIFFLSSQFLPEPNVDKIPGFKWINWEKIKIFKSSVDRYNISRAEYYQDSKTSSS
ncbi:unnamed protein product [Lepeophtheirus salmonis]|uniref:tRNA pseudouridine synthase n=1 Tax=Lepeophtheirus salmonis TaxID=72036 RepID=A0A7R8CBI9_LEPSM|nr:unnamed protein product [Lepeophtheirus salmonis]CAF2758530.1 unnamed protein product [Lepeophtheirus salmonis]